MGRVLEDRYRLIDVLGAGGVGVVYRAEHLKLQRSVALKVLQAEYAGKALLRQRFEREARALAALSHPHIVTVTDYGIAEGMPYLVMELLEGQTLQELIAEQGALPAERALAIGEQMLQALAFAHSQGLIHRDLKPSNVFLQAVPAKPDHVRILDFGLAKFVASDERSSGPALTQTGAVLGTPAYMAPEQRVGSEADARADVYAAGVMVYEMLSGLRPFRGDPAELFRQVLLAPVPSLRDSRPEVVPSPELEALLQRAMAKERADRFGDANEMLAALGALPSPVLSVTGAPGAGRSEVASAVTLAHPPPASSVTNRRIPWSLVPRRLGNALPLLVGAAALFLLVAVLGTGALLWAFAGPEEPSQVSRADPDLGAGRERQKVVRGAKDEAPEPANAPALPSTADEEPETGFPPDPWSTGDVPKPLQEVRDRLEAGRTVSERTDRMLRRFAVRNRDARAFLLLGRIFVQRGWRTDGVAAYERAFRADAASRGDPRMLEDLVSLVAHEGTSWKATHALESIYGAEALASVEEALADPELDGSTRRRYEQLRSALGRAEP